MFCSKCGFEIPDYSNFCLNCGLSLKNPVPEQKKRIGVTKVWSSDIVVYVETTELDVVTLCIEEYKYLGISKEYYNYPENKVLAPGTYYFRCLSHFTKSKMMLLNQAVRKKLLIDGWVETKTAGTYTKEF